MRPVETGQTIGPSSGPVGEGGSTTAPVVLTERGGSAAAPSEVREMSPSTRKQGVGSKRSRPDKLEQESGGSSPKYSYRPIVPA